MDRAAIGRDAEDFACSFLQAQGYTIIERNWRTRLGEIDIIAEKQGALVFIEVKFRSSDRFGAPEEAVDRSKLRRLERLATAYMRQATRRYTGFGIEVVCVRRTPTGFSASVIPAE